MRAVRDGLRATTVLLLAAWTFACATSASTGYDGDASAGDGAASQDQRSGPSPDAIVYGEGSADNDAGGASKSCEGLADGTPCGAAADVCHDAPVCESGACAAPQPKADGTVCAKAPDACHTDGTCSGGACGPAGTRPASYNWDPNDTYARCCGGGGKPVHVTTNDNCGVCGEVCNTGNGESCGVFNGHYYCLGCVASSACWSHCCSESFGTPYRCAASDCTTGACDSAYCPAGTHCVSGNGTTSNYCAY